MPSDLPILQTAPTYLLALISCAISGCERRETVEKRSDAAAVIIYCSVDEAFAKGVLDNFQEKTGVTVQSVFDSEAGKTTGLIQRIIAEADAGRPRGDVLWSSELFNTIQLARRGLLEPHAPPTVLDIPTRFRDPNHFWTAMAVRARVLAFDPRQITPSEIPTRWTDLSKPEFASRTAMANPLFGTTRGHVAGMFALWGSDSARIYLQDLHDGGVKMVDGNSAGVRALISGQVDFAMTDSDDVWVAQRAGASLDLRYLDMGGGGTFLVPCSVALIKGGPSGGRARAVVDYLVSAEVERMLAQSDSRNIPVREALRNELRLDWPAETEIRYERVADVMDEAISAVREILIR